MDTFVQICDTSVQELSGTSKWGKPYQMRIQTAYLHCGKPHPDPFEVVIPSHKDKEGNVVHDAPYAVREYDFDLEKSIKVSQGRLTFNPVLIPRVNKKAS